ncbi:MAG: hypothetical protein AB1491_07320 [Thermodesulfobacteriota bacterium]
MRHGGGPAKTPAPGWRFRVGVGFLVLSLVSPGFVPLVALSGLPLPWKATLSGLLLFGLPEVLALAAVAILGTTGFHYLKGKIYGFFKRHALPQAVSRQRYRLGLVLFVIPLLFGWLVPYAPHLVPGFAAHHVAMNFACDVIWLTSLFVLGGDFWDKLKALFIYEAKVSRPSFQEGCHAQ